MMISINEKKVFGIIKPPVSVLVDLVMKIYLFSKPNAVLLASMHIGQ